MKRKLLPMLLTLAMMLSFVPTVALAVEGVDSTTTVMSGVCGATGSESSVTWALTKNDAGSEDPTYTLTISGTGAMADINSSGGAPWCNALSNGAYKTKITKIVVGKDITSIGKNAFVWCKAVQQVTFEEGSQLQKIGLNGFHSLETLESITLPGSLKVIGNAAFYGCKNLKTVTFLGADTLQEIGKSAFGSCTSLVRFNSETDGAFNLPKNVTAIGASAFEACSAMTSINIPAGVNELIKTFYRCKKLENVTFDSGSQLKKLTGSNNVGVFAGTGLTSITLPDTVETIGDGCFYKSKITAVEIPASVQSIGKQAFATDTLTSISFTEGSKLKSIGELAFSDTALQSLRIPEGVETVGDSLLNNGTLNSWIQVPSTLTSGFALGYLKTIESCVLDASRTDKVITPVSNNRFKLLYLSNSSLMTNYSEHYKTAAITNGGIFPVTTQFSADQLATPVKDGCKFEGWYTDASFSEDNKVADNATAVANTTYYAKWSDSRDEIVGEGSIDFGTIFEGQTTDSQTVTFRAKDGQDADPLKEVHSASGSNYFNAAIDGMKVTISPRSDLTPGTYRDTLYVYTQDNAVHFIDVTLTVVGYEVSGQVTSYNPSNSSLQVTLSNDAKRYTAELTTVSSGSGQITQKFTFAEVSPGDYDLVITKDAHLTYTVKGVKVTDGDLDLTQHTNDAVNAIKMLAGDVNEDGKINLDDLNLIWNSANYNMDVSAATDAVCDLDGSGTINLDDLNIVWNSANYNKSAEADCTVNY